MDREQNSSSPAPLSLCVCLCQIQSLLCLEWKAKRTHPWAMEHSTGQHKDLVIRSDSTLNYFKNSPAPCGLCSTSPQYPNEFPFTLKTFSLRFIPLSPGFCFLKQSLLIFCISLFRYFSIPHVWFLYISHPKDLFLLSPAPLFSRAVDQPELHIFLLGQILTLGFLEQIWFYFWVQFPQNKTRSSQQRFPAIICWILSLQSQGCVHCSLNIL